MIVRLSKEYLTVLNFVIVCIDVPTGMYYIKKHRLNYNNITIEFSVEIVPVY